MTALPKVTSELRRIYLFSKLDQQDFNKVVKTMHHHQLEKGQRLFDLGQLATRFFLVQSGQIKLSRLSPDGQEKIIAIMRAGQTFAEAVMFMDRRVYPVCADAINPSEVLSFENNTFLEVLRGNMETCFKLMAAMSMRLHELVAEIDSLCLHNATFRLVVYLLHQVPEDVDATSHFQLPIPKGTLAARLSITRETLSRQLARLRTKGLIEVVGQNIILRDIEGLRKLVLPAQSGMGKTMI